VSNRGKKSQAVGESTIDGGKGKEPNTKESFKRGKEKEISLTGKTITKIKKVPGEERSAWEQRSAERKREKFMTEGRGRGDKWRALAPSTNLRGSCGLGASREEKTCYQHETGRECRSKAGGRHWASTPL